MITENAEQLQHHDTLEFNYIYKNQGVLSQICIDIVLLFQNWVRNNFLFVIIVQ